MADPEPSPPPAPSLSAATRMPSLIGILIVVLAFATFNAILFVPKPAGTTDSVIQQIITIVAALLGGFVGWQYGSSQSSAKKDDTNAAAIAALATSTPVAPAPDPPPQ